MTDFFKFRNNLEEAAKVKQAKKPSEVYEDELQKPEDDPCWEGYVQVGTKTVNGKEVPNCVPMEEAQVDEARRKKTGSVIDDIESTIDSKMKDVEKDLSPRARKKIQTAQDEYLSALRDLEDFANRKKNENTELSEGAYYDYPDYGPVGASEMAQTQLHFIKYAADDVTRCLKSGCPMPEWYQNKLAKIEGDMEGLYSYMKGKTRKMKAHQADRYSMGMGRGMYEQTLNEQAQSGDDEAYEKFFNQALKRFGADSPADLSKEKKKEFFDYVDKNWKSDKEMKKESYISEKLKPSDDVSKWIEDFYDSDAPQFKGKDKEERREMAVAAWLEARREAGYDVDPNPNE